MLDQIEVTILASLQTIFDQFGWAGVFGLMVFENATGISPNEIILAFAGWLLIERHGLAPGFIFLGGIYAGLGSTLGASITYWTARLGGRPLIERFAKFCRLDLHPLNKAEEQMQRWGVWLILFGRVIPGLRVLVNIPAGITRVPFPKFFITTFIGAYVWCTTLIGTGYLLGQEWMLIGHFIKQHLPLVLSLALFGIGAYLVYHFRARFVALARNKVEKKLEQEL